MLESRSTVSSGAPILEARDTKELEEEDHENDFPWLHETLDKVGERQQEPQADIGQGRVALSQLRGLPAEIWEIIFSMVCLSTKSGYSLHIDCVSRPKVLDVPTITLSHVCSRWRRVVIGCPELWSSISIHFARLSYKSKYLLDFYLKNSSGHLLNVRAQQLDDDLHPLSKLDEEIWELLAQHLWRCRQLHLEAEYFNLPELLEGAAWQIDFPNLIIYKADIPNLHAREPDEIVEPGHSVWWKALLNAPKLSTLSTYCLLPSEIFPYSQLTTLSIQFLYAYETQELSQLFALCTQLEELTLGLTWHGIGILELRGPVHLHPVELPCVHTLIIECHGLDMHDPLFAQVLGSLRMPRVEFLRLQCNGNSVMANGWPTVLLSTLERTPLLRNFLLFIECHENPPRSTRNTPSLVSLLHAIPNVEALQLAIGRNSCVDGIVFLAHTDMFFSDLFTQLAGSGTSLVPKLADLRLFMTDVVLDAASLGRVVETAAARGLGQEFGGQTSPLCYLSVTRFQPPPLSEYDLSSFMRAKRYARLMPVELIPELVERMHDLEEHGVEIMIQEADGPPRVLKSHTMGPTR
ncbi:hypothetical protein V5O48_012006 [Marasmius crinis-equi]|uniref:F-box domain-containing protein n=1 Tax=Marasmius crinis-equi TaxID=585013 RepID=A0ABR3F412_9AGAR